MTAKRIVIIGPTYPFRGGIAQHTTMIKRELEKEHDVLMISFKRQYPMWLYPGESDIDPAYEGHIEKNTEYLIDSINPRTWLKAIKKIDFFKAEVILIPWWSIYWAFCFGYISYKLKRKNNKVVFFCHNAVEHETAAWKSTLTKIVLKNASRFVVHTKEDASNLKQLIPKAQITVCPHPIYTHFPQPQKKLPRRKSLELLFYGFVRPYKGLDELIEAMALLKGQDIQLTIAGEFWKGEKETSQKIETLGLSNQIELRPRYHTSEETAELFTRADIVVLPYRSATGSGVIPIAYHYNRGFV